MELTPFSGIVWRIMFAHQSKNACEPVGSPIGRFHHSNQVALYASCTEVGAEIAIKRYVKPEDSSRIIVPLEINVERIHDLRKTEFSRSASVVWQNCVEEGQAAPTWKFSDAAREAGAQGMLYASRSRPDLTHLVLFDVSDGIVLQAGECKDWRASSIQQ